MGGLEEDVEICGPSYLSCYYCQHSGNEPAMEDCSLSLPFCNADFQVKLMNLWVKNKYLWNGQAGGRTHLGIHAHRKAALTVEWCCSEQKSSGSQSSTR